MIAACGSDEFSDRLQQQLIPHIDGNVDFFPHDFQYRDTPSFWARTRTTGVANADDAEKGENEA